MNIPLLAAEIVSRVRNSMRDSAINQETVVANMIREAIRDDEAEALDALEIQETQESK